MTSPNIDPFLLISIKEAIDHKNLADKVKPVTIAWVKKNLTKILKEHYTSSIDWLAFTISRSAEDDPLDNDERMAIFLACSELMAVYKDDLARLLPAINMDDPLEVEKLLNWSRAIMTMGYLLSKEGIDYDQPV